MTLSIKIGLIATCAMLAACSDDRGTGTSDVQGREIAETGEYNGQTTHGEGVGPVDELGNDAQGNRTAP